MPSQYVEEMYAVQCRDREEANHERFRMLARKVVVQELPYEKEFGVYGKEKLVQLVKSRSPEHFIRTYLDMTRLNLRNLDEFSPEFLQILKLLTDEFPILDLFQDPQK